jgi:hypothetical protein
MGAVQQQVEQQQQHRSRLLYVCKALVVLQELLCAMQCLEAGGDAGPTAQEVDVLQAIVGRGQAWAGAMRIAQQDAAAEEAAAAAAAAAAGAYDASPARRARTSQDATGTQPALLQLHFASTIKGTALSASVMAAAEEDVKEAKAAAAAGAGGAAGAGAGAAAAGAAVGGVL